MTRDRLPTHVFPPRIARRGGTTIAGLHLDEVSKCRRRRATRGTSPTANRLRLASAHRATHTNSAALAETGTMVCAACARALPFGSAKIPFGEDSEGRAATQSGEP